MPGFQPRGFVPMMNYRNPGRYGSQYNGGQDSEPDPNSDQFRKLFIGGLNYETDEASLKEYFSKWGEITDCIVMRDTTSKRSRGFGFITFKAKESIEEVQCNRPHRLDSRDVETKRAMPKDDPNSNQLNVKKMFVGGLKDDTTEEMIRQAFGEFGKIVEVELISDKASGKIKGFCFVTFDDYDSVDKCVLKRRVSLNSRKVEMKKAFAKGEVDNRMMGLSNRVGMNMPMGRGGRGDFGNGYGGRDYAERGGYGFPNHNFGGGYQGNFAGPGNYGWQGGYNEFPYGGGNQRGYGHSHNHNHNHNNYGHGGNNNFGGPFNRR